VSGQEHSGTPRLSEHADNCAGRPSPTSRRQPPDHPPSDPWMRMPKTATDVPSSGPGPACLRGRRLGRADRARAASARPPRQDDPGASPHWLLGGSGAAGWVLRLLSSSSPTPVAAVHSTLSPCTTPARRRPARVAPGRSRALRLVGNVENVRRGASDVVGLAMGVANLRGNECPRRRPLAGRPVPGGAGPPTPYGAERADHHPDSGFRGLIVAAGPACGKTKKDNTAGCRPCRSPWPGSALAFRDRGPDRRGPGPCCRRRSTF